MTQVHYSRLFDKRPDLALNKLPATSYLGKILKNSSSYPWYKMIVSKPRFLSPPPPETLLGGGKNMQEGGGKSLQLQRYQLIAALGKMFEGKKMGLGEGITPAPRNPKGGLFPPPQIAQGSNTPFIPPLPPLLQEQPIYRKP